MCVKNGERMLALIRMSSFNKYYYLCVWEGRGNQVFSVCVGKGD